MAATASRVVAWRSSQGWDVVTGWCITVAPHQVSALIIINTLAGMSSLLSTFSIEFAALTVPMHRDPSRQHQPSYNSSKRPWLESLTRKLGLTRVSRKADTGAALHQLAASPNLRHALQCAR